VNGCGACVQSNRLLLTNIAVGPADDPNGVAQTIVVESINRAGVVLNDPNRQESDNDFIKPAPRIVTRVPPEIEPKRGFASNTIISSVYMNVIPLNVKSEPLFKETSNGTGPDMETVGEVQRAVVEEIKCPLTITSPNRHLNSSLSLNLS
jgi:hypothetical protein